MSDGREWSMDESTLIETERCLEQWLGGRRRVTMGVNDGSRYGAGDFYSNCDPLWHPSIRIGHLRLGIGVFCYPPAVSLDGSLAGSIRVVATKRGGGYLLQVDGVTRALLANAESDFAAITEDARSICVVNATDLAGIEQFHCCEDLHILGKATPAGLSWVSSMPALVNLTLHEMPELESIDFLTGLPGLEALRISDCRALEDLGELSSHPKLKELLYSGRSRDDGHTDSRTPELDATQVASARSLRKVVLEDIHVEHLDALAELTDLEQLDTRFVRQAEPIARFNKLVNLRTLRANAENVGDCKELGGLARLQTLSLAGTITVDSLSWLSLMPDLWSLDIDCQTELKEPLALPLLPKLKSLCLGHRSAGCTLESIGRLQGLENLAIHTWDAPDFQALTRLRRLKSLGISNSAATSVAGLEALTSLEKLDMPLPGGLNGAAWLSTFTNLRHLRLKNAACIGSLGFAAPMSALKELELGGATHLETIADAPPLGALRKLDLSKCEKLASLEGIENLSGLVSLRLEGMPDNLDLSPLCKLKKLDRVNLSLASVRWEESEEHWGKLVLPPGGLDDCMEVLCDSPSLRFATLDSYDHRSAEIEAELARKRGDTRFVRSHFDEWIGLARRGINPDRTVPVLLRAMVETATSPADWAGVEQLVSLVRKWGSAWESAQKTLADNGVPNR